MTYVETRYVGKILNMICTSAICPNRQVVTSLMDILKVIAFLLCSIFVMFFTTPSFAGEPVVVEVGTLFSGGDLPEGKYTFVSNNLKVAAVNSRGVISALSPGEAKIKCFGYGREQVMPLRVLKPDEAKLMRQKMVIGEYRQGGVYGPRLTPKELAEVRNRIEYLTYYKIPKKLNDGQKIVAILAILKATCIYADDWSKNRANTAWGALVYGEAQCSGFARGFKALSDALGLECRYVRGSEGPKNGRHQWVMIKYNGDWFHLEPQEMFVPRYIYIAKEGITAAYDGVPVTFLREFHMPYEGAEALPKAAGYSLVLRVMKNGNIYTEPSKPGDRVSFPMVLPEEIIVIK